MDVRLQSKLLRAIQERVIDRVGGTKPVAVDIRIIATSNRNLAEAVRSGTFREDLLFRLNVVNLKIPSLRERPADILELAQHFAKKYADANGVPLRPISPEARRVLTSNRWQGNVRELENTIHRAVLMAQGDEIGADAILTPDGDRLDLAKTAPAVAHATFAAEQVTRALVGRTVADVERDLGNAEALPRQPHPRRQHPRHLDPHAAQQAERIRRWRAADPAGRLGHAGLSTPGIGGVATIARSLRIARRVRLAENMDGIAGLKIAPRERRIGIEREIGDRERADAVEGPDRETLHRVQPMVPSSCSPKSRPRAF
jgi:DNA-binding NtrC family response regulator